MSDSLAALFPDGDYRFHLTLRRVEPEAFFRPRAARDRLLAERARWLDADSACYAAIAPAGEPPLREFAALAAVWAYPALGDPAGAASGEALVRQLGRSLEPDFLLLAPDADGQFRLRGGCLCFPTGWALREKLGHTLEFIHGVVPGLNATLASPIQQFLARLKPGAAFLRDNWGIAATEELNLHPGRKLPPPGLPLDLSRLWLRVEHQALLALPASRGIVFGIRIALHRLDELAGGPHAPALRRALATMPPEVIAYKRLDRILPTLLNVL